MIHPWVWWCQSPVKEMQALINFPHWSAPGIWPHLTTLPFGQGQASRTRRNNASIRVKQEKQSKGVWMGLGVSGWALLTQEQRRCQA